MMEQRLQSKSVGLKKKAMAVSVFLTKAVFVVGGLFALWILFLRANAGLELNYPSYMIIGFCLILALVSFGYYYIHKRMHWLENVWFLRILGLVALVVGVALRSAFLSFNDFYIPYGDGSDTGIHWYAAQEILETGTIQSFSAGVYEASFPYLTTFTGMVALAMKIFGVNYTAILIPNIICDVAAAVLIYVVLLKWKNRQAATFGFVMLLLNPLSVVFCVEGLALSYTNFFLVLVIFCIYFLWISLQTKKYRTFFILSLLTGILLSIGNSFRSIFVVILIAIVILLVTNLLRRVNKKNAVISVGSILVIGVAFVCSNMVMDVVHHRLNPYYQEKHGSLGWSFFVGANFDNAGRWSVEDWNKLAPKIYGYETKDKEGQVVKVEPMNLGEINAYFMHDGLMRYKDMSILNLLVHMTNKTEILFCRNEITIFRNLEEQFTNVGGFEEWYLFANDAGMWTLTIFAVLIVIFFWQIWRSGKWCKLDYFTYFVILCFCGLFASALLVEVMSRYVSVFIIPFAIMSAAALTTLLEGSTVVDKREMSKTSAISQQSR